MYIFEIFLDIGETPVRDNLKMDRKKNKLDGI